MAANLQHRKLIKFDVLSGNKADMMPSVGCCSRLSKMLLG